MPASRSRTERWRDSLDQIHQRGGALEITLAGNTPAPDPAGQEPGAAALPSSPSSGNSLIWRVRILGLTETEILVESPCALGQPVRLNDNVRLIGMMSIGQNRWMFNTRTLGAPAARGATGTAAARRGDGPSTLRLAMPDTVERCQRRNFYRMSTVELSLPSVECWALLDPSSVVAAEVANRAQILEMEDAAPGAAPVTTEAIVLPEVGPRFRARLVNIGGGGAGLMIDHGDAQAVDRPRLFWLRLDLTPQIPIPVGLTARLVHTHVDSGHNVYAGLAFEFGFNPGHREFVVDQICRYVGIVQRGQAAPALV